MDGKTEPRVRRPAPRLALALVTALAACGGGDSSAAAQASRADAPRILACDLIAKAEIEAIIGSSVGEPDDHGSARRESTGSICTFAGMGGSVLVRAWYPYHGGEPTSAAWAAKLQAERERDAAEETDPEIKEMKALLAKVRLQPLDDLGVPAAWEDMRAEAGQVALHTVKGGKGGVYLSVHADDLAAARAVTEKALARIP